jgi:hypothetical protein
VFISHFWRSLLLIGPEDFSQKWYNNNTILVKQITKDATTPNVDGLGVGCDLWNNSEASVNDIGHEEGFKGAFGSFAGYCVV